MSELLRFHPGHYRRQTSIVEGKTARSVMIENRVVRGNKLDIREFVTFFIIENTSEDPPWPDFPHRVGSFHDNWVNAYIPVAAFVVFWDAASANDDVASVRTH